ncbi:MAG: ABC transporter ATP-binding protein [Coriobacteriia bacterium]|nr:ABC transporter ATP-binding protein [Coriobacteriia bacterium]
MGILEIHDLHKSFGNKEVLQGLEMNVPEHSVYGFVGQNGAGKTTTMKIVLGLLKANSGEVFVCGEKAGYGETKTNRFIGYLPDVPEFYGYMRPMEYLSFCGEITKMSKDDTKLRSEELLSLVGLGGEKRKIKSFSRGMKQRLGIAQALLNRPELLICDEPTSALDPIGRKEILDILSAVKGETTVVFSTHVLTDVERICDYVAILHQGKLALSGPLDEIRSSRSQGGFVISFADAEDLADFERAESLKRLALDIASEGNTMTVKVSDTDYAGQIVMAELASRGIIPQRFEVMEPSLESLFAEVVGLE